MTTKVKGTEGIEFPDTTVQATAADKGPAFSARKSAAQLFSGVGSPQIAFDVEQFDYGPCFAGSTFTPTVAGVYQVNAVLSMSGGNVAYLFAKIFKNGAVALIGSGNLESPAVQRPDITSVVSGLISMNGTTDTLTVVGTTSTSGAAPAFDTQCAFSAALVRKV